MPSELSEKIVDSLLDKLSSDDSFREQFQKDPRQALASLGHAPAGDASVRSGAWACMQVKQLAGKEAIRASRDEIRKQMLTAQAAAIPISLEASRK